MSVYFSTLQFVSLEDVKLHQRLEHFLLHIVNIVSLHKEGGDVLC